MTDVKKNIRAVVCTLLALLMMLTMVSFPADVSALGISKTSFDLTKGYSTTLSVTDAGGASVKWSSSDTSVATVTSAGKVVGKKVGTATIYADVNGTRLSCKINVVGGKLSLSKSSVSMKEGEVQYVTVRAKGSHGLKAVSGDQGIVTASWVKPWDGDDIRLKLTAKKAGSTTVRIQLTQYTDVYTTIKVTVNGENNNAQLLTNQNSVSVTMDSPASLMVYSNKNNSLSYTLSDSTVAKVTEGTWSNFYCTLTITGLKAGTTNLTIARTDAPSVSKVIPITVTGSGYYVVSATALSATKPGEQVYRWVDSKTNSYKYMLLPANYDMAKANTAIAKDAGKYEYYTVYDESPKAQTSADSALTFNATVNNESVTRFVLVPKNYDKPSYNTAVAVYTRTFSYYTIYNVSPEAYKLRSNDVVKTWTTVINYKTQNRYMLLPYNYSESWLEEQIKADSGTSLGGYYGVYLDPPAKRADTDEIISFYAIANNVYTTYYILVPKNYDQARVNDIRANYTGNYEYYTLYATEPKKISSLDEIKTWTKVVDSKSTTRYVILPPGYDTKLLDAIRNEDLKSQTSSYYVVSTTRPNPIESTDIPYSWYNPTSKTYKYMLIPQNYDVLKVNDLVAKDTGVYEYYYVYSTSPSGRAEGDTVQRTYFASKGWVYMLVPANPDQSKINQGFQGVIS